MILFRRWRTGLLKCIFLLFFTSFFVLLSYTISSGDAKAIDTAARQAALRDAQELKDAIHRADSEVVAVRAPAPGINSVQQLAMIHPEAPVKRKPHELGPFYIHNEKYPKLNDQGNFIPMRRIIHLDLKGAPYKVKFFGEIFHFFKRIGATGVLLEWEDMFPYEGAVKDAVNRNAYTMEEVKTILREAKELNLNIIPLVQTFGHLEWILKLEKFKHLRENVRLPMVICFPLDEAWKIITSMIDQVAAVHKEFGMEFFHMGADEVFTIGDCEASRMKLNEVGSTDDLMLWHISRTAHFIKNGHNTTVLAWHDMFTRASEVMLVRHNLTEVLEPVIWNYAEDLDVYLPYSTWITLQVFPRIWGSSAWKGADGPARFQSHPQHYINNHRSWTTQLTRNYKQFEIVQGLIMTGWSRYDHLAVLAELLPVAIPSMAMSMETIMSGRSLETYSRSIETLQCDAPTHLGGFVFECSFPGKKVYEAVNRYGQLKRELRQYRDEDYELNGWLSRLADRQLISSNWYLDKIASLVGHHASAVREVERDIRQAMEPIYFKEDIDEYIFTYLGEDLDWLETKLRTISKINSLQSFPKRPSGLAAQGEL